jgi:hypothetical protein
MRWTDARDVRGRRASDANANAPGEYPRMIENEFDRRLSGRLTDQATGQAFQAEITGPLRVGGYGTMPSRPGSATGDAFAAVQDPDPFSDCARIRNLQAALDEYYRRA